MEDMGTGCMTEVLAQGAMVLEMQVSRLELHGYDRLVERQRDKRSPLRKMEQVACLESRIRQHS